MSDLELVKQQISALSEGERWKLREWLDTHTVDLDAEPSLRDLLRIATEVLGDEHRARRWLQSPNGALGEVPAIVARRSQESFGEVCDLLARIRYGVVS